HEVGIPKDAIQCVNGSGSYVGDLFTNSKYIRKITFTGSTEVGKILMKNSVDSIKHVTMELGGHAPLIIAEDADLDLAVQQTIKTRLEVEGKLGVLVTGLSYMTTFY